MAMAMAPEPGPAVVLNPGDLVWSRFNSKYAGTIQLRPPAPPAFGAHSPACYRLLWRAASRWWPGVVAHDVETGEIVNDVRGPNRGLLSFAHALDLPLRPLRS